MGDGWKDYVPEKLPGWDFYGVVDYESWRGALVQCWSTSKFALLSRGQIVFLDSGAVMAALGSADVWRAPPSRNDAR